jgi:hypothetical protein
MHGEEESMAVFDKYLGQSMGQGLPDNIRIKARELFVKIMKTTNDPPIGKRKATPGKRTWRRSFLDWLERG